MESLTDIILLAGAVSWLSTAIVLKNGPGQILFKFRGLIKKWLGDYSPLECVFCTSFWVGLVVLSFFVSGDDLSRALIQFFGVLGVAMALRGQSGIF